ncbi:hypothetical protein B0H11DRAFT_1907276 [Mycena galericulata]|nr:hypothetical protein B0H11DRAFT_1907276 [Mycena galericulata]
MQQSPAVFIQQKFQTWLDEHRIIRLAGRIGVYGKPRADRSPPGEHRWCLVFGEECIKRKSEETVLSRIPPTSIRQALAVLAGFPQFDTRQCRPRFIRSLGLRVQAYELADIGPTPGGPTLGAIFFPDLIAGNQKYMSFEGVVFWTWTIIWGRRCPKHQQAGPKDRVCLSRRRAAGNVLGATTRVRPLRKPPLRLRARVPHIPSRTHLGAFGRRVENWGLRPPLQAVLAGDKLTPVPWINGVISGPGRGVAFPRQLILSLLSDNWKDFGVNNKAVDSSLGKCAKQYREGTEVVDDWPKGKWLCFGTIGLSRLFRIKLNDPEIIHLLLSLRVSHLVGPQEWMQPLIWAWNRGKSFRSIPKKTLFAEKSAPSPDQRLHPFLGLDQYVALQSQTLTVQVQKTTSSKYM